MGGRVKAGLSYAAFVKLGLALPEVQESTSYGTPALKVRDKLMARLKEDGATVVLRTTWEERERLMTIAPEIYFITDHYREHPWVLVRLEQASPASVAVLLAQAWLLCAPKSALKLHGASVQAMAQR